MTNREWLESLSDEEFATAINNIHECDNCENFWECDRAYCDKKIVDWLRAEHKAESDNGDKKE